MQGDGYAWYSDSPQYAYRYYIQLQVLLHNSAFGVRQGKPILIHITDTRQAANEQQEQQQQVLLYNDRHLCKTLVNQVGRPDVDEQRLSCSLGLNLSMFPSLQKCAEQTANRYGKSRWRTVTTSILIYGDRHLNTIGPLRISESLQLHRS